jgi:hypothetical protein
MGYENSMNKFVLNEYIEQKLEDNKTIIYLAKERFIIFYNENEIKLSLFLQNGNNLLISPLCETVSRF